DAEAVIAGAEEIVRRAAGREEARRRRRDRNERERHRRREEQDREAAQRRERERAEEERLRAEADGARRGLLRAGGAPGGGEEEGVRAEADGARGALLRQAAALAEACGGSVRDCFAALPDPRKRRGRRHSLPCVLALVVMAMLHGKTKLADVTAWIANVDQEMLAAAGSRAGRDGRRQAPCPKTVTRLLGMLGAQALADAVACYLAAALPAVPVTFPVSGPVQQPSLACDGRAVRGAVRPDGTSPFLLSAAVNGIVIAEREIGVKTNEIPEIGPMLLELNE